jgi:hypothetical protein
MTHWYRPLSVALWVAGLCTVGGVLAASGADIGVTLMAKGQVTATGEDGLRNLKRRSPVFEKDIIATGVDSQAQLRFKDGATLALKPETELAVESYRHNQPGQDDSVVLKMITGGLRTITGAVGKGDPEAYRLETPLATIGIRGTHYEVEFVGKELFVAFWQGYGQVVTPTCEVFLGDNQAHRYVRILENTACDLIDLVDFNLSVRPGEKTPFGSTNQGPTGFAEDNLTLDSFGPTSGDPDFSQDLPLTPGSLTIDILFPD